MDPSPMTWTRRFAGGVIADVRRRKPYYISDWTDAFSSRYRMKCLSSTLFLFFACLSPAITFGALFNQDTDGNLGALEMILSSAISGICYAFFAGQPLCIMGATGPELAYTIVFYQMCKNLEIEFMVARLWEGLWCALITIIIALTDGCAICCYVTQFTEDIFSALISLIFIIEAAKNIIRTFTNKPESVAFLTALLAFGTFGLAMTFRAGKTSLWLTKFLRTNLANFGVTISIAAFTCLSLLWKDIGLDKLKMPDSFEPTMEISPGQKRPWIINPFGMEKEFPTWAIFFTIGPAIGLVILGFLDQNLTSLLINRKASNLKKPPAYHLDLLVCGVFIYPICSFLGLPFTHAATIRSLTHLLSLTEFEEVSIISEVKGEKKEVKMKKPVDVAEQRVTQLAIHVLIGVSAFLSVVLKELPSAVLYGVFLFMGVTSIAGNALFDRMTLWLIWDRTKYPAYPFIQNIEFWRLHLYTGIQFLCLVVLYALKEIQAIAVVFPFFLIVIVFVRLAIKHIFTQEELAVLDGAPETFEPTAAGTKKIDDNPSADTKNIDEYPSADTKTIDEDSSADTKTTDEHSSAEQEATEV
eukprot:TRINITY_DN1182_c0_g1_i7.p1 TRINITY_DN1182_c0_g1~~TRINITY_DN1182_c0_g1_i7.p1  ORF type:complete len:584 (-),score=81.76 TRINITY_DN1182_c0_g1_i7:483-2234(-)